MIIFISAQEPKLDGAIDERFGRCSYLIKMDTESGQWEALANPGASHSGGAGVAAAQFLIDQKANVAISGDFGPHAASALAAANVEMRLFGDQISSVQQILSRYELGLLPAFK